MSNVLESRPVMIAGAELAGLSDSDLAIFGTTFDRAAVTLVSQGKPAAAQLITAVSDALEAELDRRQVGQPAQDVDETALGDAGPQLSRAEANTLLTVLDGLSGRTEAVADTLFLLGLAAAVERQLAHNLAAEDGVLRLLTE